jgi:zinc transport system ATP-binding protein
MKVIEVSNLTFGYEEEPVLIDVNFFIEEGDFVTIVGPNGGGKTTLIKLMCGLLTPWSGKISIYGKSPKENSHLIGYVPQQNLLDRRFPITVEEVVLIGRVKPFVWYTNRDRKIVREVLERVGLWEARKKQFSSLSGGQMQRVLIARALASEAPILFLDEPSTNIDSKNEKQLSMILSDLKKDHTIVVVTHDTGFVDMITDRVLCVQRTVFEHSFVDDGLSCNYGYPKHYAHVKHDTLIKR